MGRDGGALWREVHRNKTRGKYEPLQANHKAYVRRKNAKYQGMKIVKNPELQTFVDKKLLEGQSPPGIAGRLRWQREKGLPYVSKDSIYRYLKSVYGRKIETQLNKRKRKTKQNIKRGILDGRVFLDQRPKHINDRMRIGHAEFDFIVSGKTGKGILATTVDRKLRAAFLEPIYKVSIPAVHAALSKIKKRYPEWQTGTTDNDLLFARHQELAKELKIKIYFCNPYHSWEKGTVENVNKYIRRDIPKGTDLSKIDPSFISYLEQKLNRRPMKCLGYQTPQEKLNTYRHKKKH